MSQQGPARREPGQAWWVVMDTAAALSICRQRDRSEETGRPDRQTDRRPDRQTEQMGQTGQTDWAD